MSLSERSAASGIGTGRQSEPAQGVPVAGALPTARHCWLITDTGVEIAALLVQWRTEPGGWTGRVVVADVRDETLSLTEFWVPSTQLRAARDIPASPRTPP